MLTEYDKTIVYNQDGVTKVTRVTIVTTLTTIITSKSCLRMRYRHITFSYNDYIKDVSLIILNMSLCACAYGICNARDMSIADVYLLMKPARISRVIIAGLIFSLSHDLVIYLFTLVKYLLKLPIYMWPLPGITIWPNTPIYDGKTYD